MGFRREDSLSSQHEAGADLDQRCMARLSANLIGSGRYACGPSLFADPWSSSCSCHVPDLSHRREKHSVRVAQKALLPTRYLDHLLYWVSRELSLSKLQDQIPGRTRRPLLMGSPAAAQGHKGDDGPTAMKHQPRHKDHLARYGSDHRSSPEFLDRRNRGRVDEKLAIVGGGLDEKDPAVGSPNTAPSRLEPSDV